jgi:hypothetical protein
MLHLAIDYGAYDVSFCCEEYLAEGNKPVQFEFWAEGLTGNLDAELARSRMRAIVVKQRSNILALLQQQDMEQLLAPLIPPSSAGK